MAAHSWHVPARQHAQRTKRSLHDRSPAGRDTTYAQQSPRRDAGDELGRQHTERRRINPVFCQPFATAGRSMYEARRSAKGLPYRIAGRSSTRSPEAVTAIGPVGIAPSRLQLQGFGGPPRAFSSSCRQALHFGPYQVPHNVQRPSGLTRPPAGLETIIGRI